MGNTLSGVGPRPILVSIAYVALSAGYHELPLPIIVVACKSESARVSSETVADILDPFHIGLVEVMATTEKGKNKMRMALVWTIQVSKLVGRNPRLFSLRSQAILRQRGGRGSSTSLASTVSSAMSTSQTI